MKFSSSIVSLILLTVWFAPALAEESVTEKKVAVVADLVLRDGQVFTMDAARNWAHAVAISGDRIVYVGADSGAKRFIGPKTKMIDLKGKMVLPGFIDSHVHPLGGGESLFRCNLDKATTATAALDIMRAHIKAHPLAPGEWFLASGWKLPLWTGGNPLKSDLDKIVGDNPALITASDHHSVWVNSLALSQAKIDKYTVDPPNGRIERDPQTGEPSGTLRESAMQLVSSHVPSTLDDRVRFLLRGLHEANSFGITSMQDADVDEPILEAYKRVQDNGELTVRIVAALHVNPAKGVEQIANLAKLRAQYTSGLLRAMSAKLFVDGVMETHTAALLQPYLTKNNVTSGTLNFRTELLNALATKLDAEGFQIHMHAIGDGAVRQALDALVTAENKNGQHDLRHQLAHLQLVDPADVPRFLKLRAVANFEPYWFYPDSFIRELTEPVLGPQRSSRLYPMRSLVKSGALVSAGSDWPVTTLNPLDGIEVAVTRIEPGSDASVKSWLSDQCIDLTDAIAAYTINGAFVNHEDKDVGSIEVGKCADLIVLDKNLFAIAPSKIHTAKVLCTYLAGKEVFKTSRYAYGDLTPEK